MDEGGFGGVAGVSGQIGVVGGGGGGGGQSEDDILGYAGEPPIRYRRAHGGDHGDGPAEVVLLHKAGGGLHAIESPDRIHVNDPAHVRLVVVDGVAFVLD